MECWFYDAEKRALLDENRLPVAQGVNPTDAAQILAALKGPHAALADVIADMLNYEAEEFDPEPIGYRVGGFINTAIYDTREQAEAECGLTGMRPDSIEEVYDDLDVSGSDLVDAFTVWRRRLRAALSKPTTPQEWVPHTGDDYSVVMRPDETTDAASIRVHGRDHEDAAALAQQIACALNHVPRTIAISLEGGEITGIIAPDGAPDLTFRIIDYDDVSMGDVAHEVLNSEGDWEEVFITDLKASQEPLPQTRDLDREPVLEPPAAAEGYDVQERPEGGFLAFDFFGLEIDGPGGVDTPYPTREAAWAACDAHFKRLAERGPA